MATLLLRLQGPMQAWGTRSRFDHRDTNYFPTKSGVLGLICAALGRDRDADISDLLGLRMGVRIDQPGVLRYDYQTAKDVLRASGEGLQDVVQSWRWFLADAAFLVGLEGEKTILVQAHAALRNPRWPLFLGRKGYVPSPPIYLPDGLQDIPLEEALATYPFLPALQNPSQKPPEIVRYVLEASDGQMIWDQPVAPFAARRFGPRFVREILVPFGEVPRVPL